MLAMLQYKETDERDNFVLLTDFSINAQRICHLGTATDEI